MERSWAGLLAAAALLLALPLAGSSSGGDLAWVTCGSTIKLAHEGSKFRLHSHEVAYSRGSRQQSVTAFPDSDDANSYWAVHGTKDEPCAPGSPVKKQQRLRLQHVATRRWLHSHLFQSPLSANQEVSAFGGDSQSDGGDVTLRHVDTGAFLHSLRHATFGHPIAGQHEVCAIKTKGPDSQWFAAEGVYLPRADKKAKAAGGGDASERDEL
ncbi:stromal cell-derived factor [Raphidocelis subcapitata]|uniref:Stromal cell-derived factor n=1 Tax=Raphidocelis subcapitata TaxID=307507 RepID=A0A2V0P668_9CHLO|nr:stromal cell-derived factor [Raphidocelis subcapitata]|eukprot:GBF94422.1 stromal cell-derived factor [Raphidocelis subcapitata]